MPYDEDLAVRVRAAFGDTYGLTERVMFGGICFMLNGNMTCGVVKDRLMVRVGRDAYEATLARPHTAPMTFTGRPLSGMIYVLPEGLKTSRALTTWVKRAAAFAQTLPAKKKTAKKKTKAARK
jgi:TfoX/Sxy family transcriptional regulator of competence genes